MIAAKLDEARVAQYHTDGFLVVRQVFSRMKSRHLLPNPIC